MNGIFFDKRVLFDLNEHKADIRLPIGEYRLETSFGEEIPYIESKRCTINNTFTLTADIPRNAACLYVFKKKKH